MSRDLNSEMRSSEVPRSSDRAESPEAAPLERTIDDESKTTLVVRRKERKYVVGVGAATFLREEVERRLPVFCFVADEPSTYITTVYFDTEALDLYNRAERHYDENLKLRVKEYLYPVRDADGTDSGRAFRATADCYIEMKRHVQGYVLKKRLRLPKAKLGPLLAGEDVWTDVVGDASVAAAEKLQSIYAELRECLRCFSVRASSIVNYRRRVYQNSEDDVRITFDDRIAVFPAVDGLYESVPALERSTLGIPTYRGQNVILEIKSPGAYPDWLSSALRNHSSKQLSKFTTSIRALKDPSSVDGRLSDSTAVPDETTAAPDGDLTSDDTQRVSGDFY